MDRALRILAARNDVAAGRDRGAGGGAVRAGLGRGGETRAAAGDDGDGGIVAGAVRACGLPLALGCRRLWRLGYRRGAWTTGVALGAVTVAVTLPAGLLGPVATAVCAVLLSLPIWIALWWLAWRG